MSTFEEETVATLHTLFTKVATLQQINIRDILKPDTYRSYERTIQEAYDASKNALLRARIPPGARIAFIRRNAESLSETR